MNPLTLVKRIQNINSKEAALGVSEEASWHAKYKDSAYVFVGGVPFDLTEGDLLAVFAQYGEIVDVNLVRDKGTGKSKGFAFIAYEDQRSTNLAVDNLNGAQILGRIVRVDHVSKYKKKEEEDEETIQQKREARGVCRAFQRGECNRGAGCKFSHDGQRAANTGWGAKDDKNSKWGHDKFEGPKRSERRSGLSSCEQLDSVGREVHRLGEDSKSSGVNDKAGDIESHCKGDFIIARDEESRRSHERRKELKDKELNHKEHNRMGTERVSSRHEFEPKSRDDRERREENRVRKLDVESRHRRERQSDHDDRDSSFNHQGGADEYHRKRLRR